VIGILGAAGAVGRAVTAQLGAQLTGQLGGQLGAPLRAAGMPLRLGARDPRRLRCAGQFGEFSDGPAGVEVRAVDLHDPAGLAAFCAGCQVVVNCAGPSYRVLAVVARAALAAGADYVDPAGDDPVHDLLRPADPAALGRRVVLSAGLLPGLSGLLPRLLAADLDTVDCLQAYAGGLAALTPVAARDFLLSDSAGIGEPLAAWCDGRRRARALRPLRDAVLPFFPDRVAVYPYLPTEIERIAARIGARQARWYNVFPAGRAEGVLRGLWAAAAPDGATASRLDTPASLDAAAEALIAGVRLDLAGRTPYHRLVVQVAGRRAGRARVRTLVVGSADGYQPTAAMTVAAVDAVVRGAVPPGLHYAAEVLAADAVRVRLAELPGATVTGIDNGLPVVDLGGNAEPACNAPALHENLARSSAALHEEGEL